jgi:hypothetical protein
VSGGPRSVAESGLPSREVAAPCRVSILETLAPLLVPALPSCPSPSRLGFRVFTFQGPGRTQTSFQDPLMGFGSSSEVAQAHKPPL